MSGEYQGALFDLDGVLVDTAVFHFLAWQQVARRYGFELGEEAAEATKGVSRRAALDIVMRSGGVDLPEAEARQVANDKNALYRDYIGKLDSGALLPGAAEALRYLRERGIPMAVASASRNADEILRNVGVAHLFDAIVDGRVVSEAKPSPAVFLEAARRIGVPPARCVVFEDAIAGVEGGLRAGAWVVGIGDPVVLAAADLVVPTLAQVEWTSLFERQDR